MQHSLQMYIKIPFCLHLPDTVQISDKLINGTVAAQLAAALLSVSCITVTFCVNLTMVQDLANGARKDFNVSPVKKSVIFWDTSFNITQFPDGQRTGTGCLPYLYVQNGLVHERDGCTLGDLDEILLVLFGCALSSIICYPLKTQGQMSQSERS